MTMQLILFSPQETPTEDARAKVLMSLPSGVAMYDFMLKTGIALRKEEEPMETSLEVSQRKRPPLETFCWFHGQTLINTT